MTRCGTCWIVLREGETVEQHAKSSRWHAEMADRPPSPAPEPRDAG